MKKEIKLIRTNFYLANAALIRCISQTANVDLFVSCKILDLIYPQNKDLQACEDFLDACREIGLNEVMTKYGQ